MVNNDGPASNLNPSNLKVFSFPPGSLFFSKTSTSKPLDFNLMAVQIPLTPEPIIDTFIYSKKTMQFKCRI